MIKPKLAHKIAFSFLSIVVVMFLAGFFYVYFGDAASTGSVTLNQSATAQYKALPPPAKPSPNESEGVALEGFDSPVAPGNTTSIIIITQPTSTCDITVIYAGGKPAADPALKPKIADAYGNVTWSWLVPQNMPYGQYPVSIACHFYGKTAVLDQNLMVKQ